jgi:hypothetical protein
MKYSLLIFYIVLSGSFLGCSKKKLPEPNPLNSSKSSAQSNVPKPLIAPCDSILVNNTISYTINLDGTQMYFNPVLDVSFDYLQIICRDFSTYNNVTITLPVTGSFIGKIKYDVKNYSNPSSTVALITHSYNSYSQLYYGGYEGSIYAEYTRTQIILTFCGVKVQNSPTDMHEITGKITVPYDNTI